MAERTKFKSYFLSSIVISALIYPVVVHWHWGGGWLAQLSTPFHDFAGSSMVHVTGGVVALMMGAIALGPRLGKYGPDGKPRAIPAHNIPYAVLGTFVLLVGWYGFNPRVGAGGRRCHRGHRVTTTLAAGHRLFEAGPVLRWRHRPAGEPGDRRCRGRCVRRRGGGPALRHHQGHRGLRVTEEEELAGLDVLEHGAPGYALTSPCPYLQPHRRGTRPSGAAV